MPRRQRAKKVGGPHGYPNRQEVEMARQRAVEILSTHGVRVTAIQTHMLQVNSSERTVTIQLQMSESSFKLLGLD